MATMDWGQLTSNERLVAEQAVLNLRTLSAAGVGYHNACARDVRSAAPKSKAPARTSSDEDSNKPPPAGESAA